LRGVEYWPGNARHAPRILFGTRDGRLIALDAASGVPIKDFGDEGVVNLATPDIVRAAPSSQFAQYGMTSPPIVYRDLVITGAAVQEFPQRGAAGDVRAWDVVTGRLRWTFHTVPRAGEFGNDTWEAESWRDRSGTNVWGFMTVDVKRGMVFLPVAAPAWDRYGGDRKGDNLFGSSVVALDADTGRRLWHFQLVRHDIWDFDTESPPLLIEVRRGSRRIPAVAVVAKSGMLYILDRKTGKSLFPVDERRVPKSDVPGEVAASTQPFSSIEPFARQSFSLEEVAAVTPELEAFCKDFIARYEMHGAEPFTPIGFGKPTIHFPGRLGGANWGGATFDPGRRLLFVNASNLGHVEVLSQREDGAMTNASPASGRFSDRERRLMCQRPPWGTLTAYDVDGGKIVWQVPLGVTDALPEAARATGRPNIGGAITTAGGLVFIGATDDARFRAFDAASGRELWSVKLAASAHATPITYRGKDGKQYVAIIGTGGSFLDSPVDSDALTVFALP
jgi:quinoprotein glucose dehydrogenase